MLQPGISVLVLYENFAVGAAVLRRLLDLPMVHMVRADSAGACEAHYDVVVFCPYLREHRRAQALRQWAEGRRTSVIEIEDDAAGGVVRMLAGRSDSGPANAVLGALRLGVAAA